MTRRALAPMLMPLLACAALLVAPRAGAQVGTPQLALQTIASGLNRPVDITHAGDGSGRLFIAQQTGQILVWDGAVLPTPFLDIGALVSCCGERGLLGVAFHPGYAANGQFYVSYTDNGGDNVVARYNVSAGDPDVADPNSAFTILTVNQLQANHNGGQIRFGPDGYLYFSIGDGGGGGDPADQGQDLSTLLGKLLRLDVDGGSPYAVPADNPFVGVAGAQDEIWAYGLRNPWRFSFDRLTGDLFIGDVGQGTREEVDFQSAASPGGENYGWNCREGSIVFNTNPPFCDTIDPADLTFPVLEYTHSAGRCSVTGGFRYRGSGIPRLRCWYLYADYCTGEVWGARPAAGGAWTETLLLDNPFLLSSFGEDEEGEIYIAELSATNGAVHRVVDNTAADEIFVDGFECGDLLNWSATVAP